MNSKDNKYYFFAMLPSIFLILFSASCGYHTGDSRTPETHLKVFVPVFENRTASPIDLNEMTGLLRESLDNIQNVETTIQKERADFLVLGKVTVMDRSWGSTYYKGDSVSESRGGLKNDALSAETARLTLTMTLEKVSKEGKLLWRQSYTEQDYYQLTDRLELSQGSAAAPQIHSSRETLLTKKLAERIFRRARAQIVDDF